ncbi:MAG: hypothetical protein WAT93_05280 [Pontixanthobacter sp.]
MKFIKFASVVAAIAVLAGGWTVEVAAQEEGQREVMLSPARMQQSGRAQTGVYNPAIPATGMIRTADFAVRSVTIEGDTREKELRDSEIREMVANTIKTAKARGIELSFGSMTIERLDLDNFDVFADSNVFGGSRPDTSRISFLVKIPLDANSTLAKVTEQMDNFQKAVKPVGRSQFVGTSAISLSIVKPDQYRSGIIDLISADAQKVSGQIGPNYAAALKGLHQPVDWVRWGDLQIMLFVPYEMEIVPAG